MGRPRRRKRRSKIKLVLVLAAVAYAIYGAYEFLLTPQGKWIGGAFAVAFVLLTARRLNHWRRTRSAIQAVAISTDPRDYVITPHDYKRGSPKEAHYRKIMQLPLLATYENRCAKCGVDDNGLDLDHFFLPKNAGGSFIMRHRDGYLVNNAVPLCESCNRSKSDRDFAEFFDEHERLRIFQKNVAMTRRLNERGLLDGEGRVARRRTAG